MHGFAYLTTSLCNMVHNIMSQIAAKIFILRNAELYIKRCQIYMYLHINIFRYFKSHPPNKIRKKNYFIKFFFYKFYHLKKVQQGIMLNFLEPSVICDTLVHNMGLELLVKYSLQDIKQFLYFQLNVEIYRYRMFIAI